MILERYEPEIDAELDARVGRGAALLDRIEPGWAERVALDRLAMESCDRCILGQIYGGYVDGCRILASASRYSFGSASHAFTLYDLEQDPRYVQQDELLGLFDRLGDAWRRAVRARIGGGP